MEELSMQGQEPYADNCIPVIPAEGGILHTPTNPFCPLPCPCHEDQENIAVVSEHVQGGLLTPDEATDFVNGKML
jgi:hypothetical protein